MLRTWTTSDFDDLCWHDCHIHGVCFTKINDECGTAELEIDIDFIVDWISDGMNSCKFRIAPANLTFHDVFGLRVELDYASVGAGMTPFSINGIEREIITYPGTDVTSFRWRLPINWPAGEITFQSPGFTQIMRSEPIEHDGQCLKAEERER